MIFSKTATLGGEWHCPFSREWVAQMKRAVQVCMFLDANLIEAAIKREAYRYEVPPGDFLSEPQDARGLPLSWCKQYEERHRHWPRCCTATYDYDSIPEMVITNGTDDWPLKQRLKVLHA